MTVVTAESCTGGNVAARISSVPGSSGYFLGGVVAYHNAVKSRVLRVPSNVLERFGAVSAECARAMADGARSVFDSDFAVSTTGVAGPGGGTQRKPVGLVYVGVACKATTQTVKCQFEGNRHDIVAQATERALQELRKMVEAQFSESIPVR